MNHSVLKILLGIFTVAPGCAPGQTVLAFQGFEPGDGYSYTTHPGSGQITLYSFLVASGTNALRLTGSTNNSDPYILFSNVSVSGYSLVTVKVAYAASGPDINDDLYLDISYDNGGSYPTSVKLADGFSNGNLLFGNTYTGTQTGSCCIVSQANNPYTFSLPANQTQVKLRVRFDESASTNTSDHYFIDDITIEGLNIPPAPQAQAASGLAHNGFSAGWSPVAGAASYVFDLATTADFTSMVSGYQGVSANDTIFSVSGLNANTTYYYRVAAVAGGQTGDYSDTVTVLTDHDPATTLFRSLATGSFYDTGSWEYNRNGQGFQPAGDPPGTSNSIMIQSGHQIKMDSLLTDTIAGLEISSGSLLEIDSAATLHLTGDLENNGTVRGKGLLACSGTVTQSITGSGSLGNLRLDNTAGLTIGSGLQEQTLTGVLEVAAGTLYTNGNLRIASTASDTAASVGMVTGSISGGVVIERFLDVPAGGMSSGRSWRLLTAPVKGDTGNTVYAQWQNNGSINGGGLEIWGPAGTAMATGQAYSLRKYDAASSSYQAVTNTQTELLFDTVGNRAFLAFVSGPYGSGNIASGASATRLEARGTLITGPVLTSFNAAAAGDLRLIGNPYACAVDFEEIFTNPGTTNLSPRFWTIDPNLNEIGGYVLVTRTGPGSYVTVPASAQGRYLHSGQAFFIEAASPGNAALSFEEDDKVSTATQAPVFRTNNGSYESIQLNLRAVPPAGSPVSIDGALVRSHNNFNWAYDIGKDAMKFFNPGEDIGIGNGSRTLSLASLPLLDGGDTIQIMLGGLQPRNYELEIVPDNFNAPGLTALLADSFLQVSVPVSLTGNTVYPFAVTGEPGSAAVKRFRIQFTNASPLSLAPLSLTGTLEGSVASLRWTMEEEPPETAFLILRSTDAIVFDTVAGIPGNLSQHYSYKDIVEGMLPVWYRVLAYARGGQSRSSRVLRIGGADKRPLVNIFPNPATGSTARLVLQEVDDGPYTVTLQDIRGRVMKEEQLVAAGNSAMGIMDLRMLPKGIYLVRLLGANGCVLQTSRLELF